MTSKLIAIQQERHKHPRPDTRVQVPGQEDRHAKVHNTRRELEERHTQIPTDTKAHTETHEHNPKGTTKCPEPQVEICNETIYIEHTTHTENKLEKLDQREKQQPKTRTKIKIQRQPGRTPAKKRKRTKDHMRPEQKPKTDTEPGARNQVKKEQREQEKQNQIHRKPREEGKTVIQYLIESAKVVQRIPPQKNTHIKVQA